MPYRTDLRSSARRHLRAADELFATDSAGSQPGCRAVAGSLFGLCGELAVKVIMRDSGMSPLPDSERRDDPLYAHFPQLKTRLRDAAHGRRSGELRKIAETTGLFQHWDTDMRYAPTADIPAVWVEAWRASAHELVNRMESV